MNRSSFLIAVLFAVILVSGFAFASGEVYKLSQKVTGVSTSNGQTTLLAGTNVGGNPANYILLAVAATLPTTQGPIWFPAGTKIDCEHEWWEPDPCDPD